MPVPNTFSAQTKSSSGESGNFPLMPQDVYTAVVKDVQEKVEPSYNDPNSLETKLNVTFQITEGEHQGRLLWKSMRPIVSGEPKPSWLFKVLQATSLLAVPETVDGTLINRLVGQPLRLVVGQKAKRSGGMRNEINDVLPPRLAASLRTPTPAEIAGAEDSPF